MTPQRTAIKEHRSMSFSRISGGNIAGCEMMNPKAREPQESEFEIIGEASDGKELELTHERKREIDTI